jgi:hypothetical protein
VTTPIVESVPPSTEQPPAYVVPGQPTNEQYFTAGQVEAFRQQERDKLYPKLAKQDEVLAELRGQVSSFMQEREATQAAEKARQQEEAETARKAAEEEMSARQLLEQQRAEWENRFQQMEQERAMERAALEKDKELATLQGYIQRRVREEQQAQTIAPELLDLVNGNTEQEVEESINRLKVKTEAIVKNMQAATGVQPVPRGVSTSGYAAMGPMEMNSELRDPTPEELRAMPMDSYIKWREKRFGPSASKGQGIFG